MDDRADLAAGLGCDEAYRGRIVLLRPDRFVAASWLPGKPPPSPATLHLGAAFART